MDDLNESLKLRVPEQRLTALSFCEATPRALEKWVRDLPMANIGETAKRLYHAQNELNQLIIAPTERYALIELIRDPVYFVCGELAKHYLNQPVVLPEKPRKIANLCQALQLNLANGYKHIVLDSLAPSYPEKVRRTLATACHRAISDLSRTILRANQLYSSSPQGAWLEIHQLFAFAEEQNLLKYAIEDGQNRHRNPSTIGDAYHRILLLACARPNQLRQSDLAMLFHTFEAWSRHVYAGRDLVGDALFIIDPDTDKPPVYRTLAKVNPNSRQLIGFDTSQLAKLLTDHLASLHKEGERAEAALELPERLAESHLSHLAKAFGVLTKRTFNRIDRSGVLQVTVGLTSTHYHCAGGVEFAQQLLHQENDDPNDNYFLRQMRRKDVWGGAGDASRSRDERLGGTPELTAINYTGPKNQQKSDAERNYPVFSVPLVNTSPGGYCLQWQGNVPGNLQAGELLGIRENDREPWAIAVVRWIRRIQQTGTQLGVELLAPSAEPVGVQLVQKTGDSSEFLRGLLMPELPSIGQPATLITPRLPFQAGSRVILNQRGRESKCLLTRRLCATGSFNQFEFRPLSAGGTPPPQTGRRMGGTSEDEFDSLWPSL